MQKAEVVEMAQGNGANVVLAVGDGANDVPMIRVGVANLLGLFYFVDFVLITRRYFENSFDYRQQTLELGFPARKDYKPLLLVTIL